MHKSKIKINNKGLSPIITVGIIAILSLASIFILLLVISNIVKNNIALSPQINCLNLKADPPIILENACYEKEKGQINIKLAKSITSEFNDDYLSILVDTQINQLIFNCNPNICSYCSIIDSINTEEYFIPIDNSLTPKTLSLKYMDCIIQSQEIPTC